MSTYFTFISMLFNQLDPMDSTLRIFDFAFVIDDSVFTLFKWIICVYIYFNRRFCNSYDLKFKDVLVASLRCVNHKSLTDFLY
jgi:hypothetical protein